MVGDWMPWELCVHKSMQTVRTDDGLIHVMPKLLSDDLMERMLMSANDKGWEPALVNIGNGKQAYKPNTRKCDRSLVMDPELCLEIWNLVKHVVPTDTSFGTPVGLNPLLRFLKYDPGDYFKIHNDGTYVDDKGHESRLTVQMYLNEGYTGGETVFYSGYGGGLIPKYTHAPHTGDVVVFDQRIPHEGAVLRSGTKLAVRTEIMFDVGEKVVL